MDKPWSKFCSLGIVHFMAFPQTASGEGPIAESVSTIAQDDFFDGIEITWIHDPATRTAVKQILAASHMRIGFGAHPAILSHKLNLNSLDEEIRRHAIETLKPIIDQAAEMEAERFVVLSGPNPITEDRDFASKALLDSIRQLCAYGDRLGIRLGLETFDQRIDKKAFIGPVVDAARLAKAVKTDYRDFGLIYDQGHMPLLDEIPADMVVIKDHLVLAHVGNCIKKEGRPKYGDNHPYFGHVDGENDVEELAEFIRMLFKIGYLAEEKLPRPWVSFEIKPDGPGETPALIVANAKRTWRQAWARL